MALLETHVKFRSFLRLSRACPTAHALSPLAIYARAWHEARGFRRDLLLVFALGLVGTPLSLLAPLPLKVIVDNVIGDAPRPAWLAALATPAPGSEALLTLAIAAS